jgi:phospholipase C
VSLGGLVLAACAAGLSGGGEALNGRRAPIDHIVVLFLENRSFDHLFGTYPGAWRFGLAPLTARARRAAAPLEAFDFT